MAIACSRMKSILTKYGVDPNLATKENVPKFEMILSGLELNYLQRDDVIYMLNPAVTVGLAQSRLAMRRKKAR